MGKTGNNSKPPDPLENCVQTWTIDDVARFLRIPRKSVYLLAQNGEIPCAKFGKHWRFCRELVEAWFRARMLGQEAAEAPCPAKARGRRGAAKAAK